MRVIRAYVEGTLAPGHRVRLPDSAAAHLVRVLRLQAGDACVLFNGDGHDYAARITAADRRGVEAEVLSARIADNESPLRVTLVQGIARGEKMDWILQKAAELGVAAVVPVHSERSEVKLDGERAARRAAHWQGVLVSACEQSGRACLPALAAPRPLREALATLPPIPRYLLDPLAGQAIASLAPAPTACVVAVGPEGGWSPRDHELLREAGCTGLRLGPRILRTETAGLAAIAALQAVFGDLR